jgi:molybdenum cofactor cytidylyltransferase
MYKVMLTAQAYNDMMALPSSEIDITTQALNYLELNPASGLKLWGQDGLYLRQTISDTRIIYRITGSEIQVLGIKSEAVPLPAQGKRLRIAAVVLAAGHTTYSDTLPLSGIVDSFLSVGVDDLIMVVGDHAEQARHELCHRDITLVVNSDYEEGLSKSLRYGLKMLSPQTRAVMLSLGNRPFITPEIVLRLIRAYKTSKTTLVVPSHSQMRGHPVLFDTCLVPELLRTQGHNGGRSVIEHHNKELTQIDIDDAGILERIWPN